MDGIAHYNCSCPAGFSGSRCQTNVDDCLSDPCLNNGTCVDGVAGYLCNCHLGFRGDDCEIDIQVIEQFVESKNTITDGASTAPHSKAKSGRNGRVDTRNLFLPVHILRLQKFEDDSRCAM